MATKSTPHANEILDFLFGAVALVPPGTYYVSLWTSAPSAAEGGTEVSGGSYARVAITNNKTNFTNAASGQVSNATEIEFAQASAGWGSVVAVGLHSAASGAGNLKRFAALSSPRTVAINDTVSFPIGSLVLGEI